MAYSKEISEMGTSAKKENGTSYANYKEAADANSVIEEQIGLSLAKNGQLLNVAKNIAEKSQVALDAKDKSEIEDQANKFGGARASQEGVETLGRYVFETMHHIEKDKAKYSRSRTIGHPYFPTGQKKPEFDKPLADCKWEELPEEAQTSIDKLQNAIVLPAHEGGPNVYATKYDDLNSKTKGNLLEPFRFKDDRKWKASGGISSSTQEARDAINAYKNAPTEGKREIAFTAIKAALSQVDLSDKEKATLGAALDIVADKHTNGDHTNLVRRDGNNGVKDKWIDDTVAAGKPIISGPSGHTLRYLNFWAEKRQEEKKAGGNITDWPSLEAARLVMMANLMPPKHHSYDEIMTSSIGIKDETKPPLQYKHKSSYLDLATHQETDAKEIALNAYAESEAKEVATDSTTDQTPEGYNSDSEKDLIDQAIETLEQITTMFPSLTTKLGSVQVALRAEKGKV